jgi:hypothetical protein
VRALLPTPNAHHPRGRIELFRAHCVPASAAIITWHPTRGVCDLEGNCQPQEVNGKRETVNALLALANNEALDAVEVLEEKGLHADAVTLLRSAISKNNSAINENATFQRAKLIQGALNDFNSAKAKFGTGLGFTLGEGNLLF